MPSLHNSPFLRHESLPSSPLPKTRSGKIMRRILKRIAAGQVDDLGDVTTLADPTVVETLVRERL
jgi:acetyl-CoA synthetase